MCAPGRRYAKCDGSPFLTVTGGLAGSQGGFEAAIQELAELLSAGSLALIQLAEPVSEDAPLQQDLESALDLAPPRFAALQKIAVCHGHDVHASQIRRYGAQTLVPVFRRSSRHSARRSSRLFLPNVLSCKAVPTILGNA